MGQKSEMRNIAKTLLVQFSKAFAHSLGQSLGQSLGKLPFIVFMILLAPSLPTVDTELSKHDSNINMLENHMPVDSIEQSYFMKARFPEVRNTTFPKDKNSMWGAGNTRT